jgi:hypothetical protein
VSLRLALSKPTVPASACPHGIYKSTLTDGWLADAGGGLLWPTCLTVECLRCASLCMYLLAHRHAQLRAVGCRQPEPRCAWPRLHQDGVELLPSLCIPASPRAACWVTSCVVLHCACRVRTQYRVAGEARLREGFELDSDVIGRLEAGEVIRVLELRQNENGVARVRCSRGWTSVRGRNDAVLLVPMLERESSGVSGLTGMDSSASLTSAASVGSSPASGRVTVRRQSSRDVLFKTEQSL